MSEPVSVDGILIPSARLVPVVELLPYANNSKTHSAAQVEAIARNMRVAGFTQPILIADGIILAGHGRLLAAKLLGLTRVPCIDLSHLSETERRAQVIWDNRSAELGSAWDLEMLKVETDYLRSTGTDLEAATGFSEEVLADLLRDLEEPAGPGDGEPDPDDTPEVPDAPVSQPGDVWVMGPHRLAVGDSTDPAVWSALLRSELCDACWTDPPYLVDVGRKNRLMDAAVGGSRSKTGSVANDKGMTEPEFADLLGKAFANLFVALKPGSTVYVAHSDRAGGIFRAQFEGVGFHFSQGLVWNKPMHVLGVADHQPSHEPILYGWKPGSRHRWYGGRKQRTVMAAGEASPFQPQADGSYLLRVGDSILRVSGEATIEEAPSTVYTEAKPAKSGLHPTQKPVALVERMLRNSARPGDIVADPFGGSGTTLVAADRLGMCARLCELDLGFADVIVRRWQALTGRRAVHAVTGEDFPEPGAGRAPQADPGPAGTGDPF